MNFNLKTIGKKTVSLILTVAVIMTCGMTVAFAGSIQDSIIVSGPSATAEGSFLYIMVSDGTCAVTGYAGPKEKISIPETIEGIPVTTVAEVMDSRYLLCEEVTIGPHIKRIIGDNTYRRINTKYKKLNIIADGLSIGEYAFFNIKSLEEVVISGNVKSIGRRAFANCNRLETVILPEGITTIPQYMFSECTSLKSIVLPSTVKTIESCAFNGCSSLKNVSIPAGIENIAGDAFKGTPVENTIKPTSKDGLIYDGHRLVAADHSKINGTVVIKTDTMAINPGVFKNCTTLTEVILPDGFSSIGEEAFANCTNLKRVSGGASTVGARAFMGTAIEFSIGYDVGDEAYKDCTSLKKVKVTAGDYGKDVFVGSTIESVYVNGSVYNVPEELFVGCNSIKGIFISNGVSTIGERAFDCNGYTDIILPETLTYVGKNAVTSENLSNVYYAMDAELTERFLDIGEGNEALTNATAYYNTNKVFYKYVDMPFMYEWSFNGLKYCLLNGLMNGTSSYHISPDGITSRAQLVTLLWRLEGSPASNSETKFEDLTDDWYAEAVKWASENGIVMGTSETTFTPDRDITRQEAAALLFRYSEYKGYDTEGRVELTEFPDSDNVMDFAYDALSWANAEGIITGVSNYGKITLDPTGLATRAQIATILMRYSEKYTSEAE